MNRSTPKPTEISPDELQAAVEQIRPRRGLIVPNHSLLGGSRLGCRARSLRSCGVYVWLGGLKAR